MEKTKQSKILYIAYLLSLVALITALVVVSTTYIRYADKNEYNAVYKNGQLTWDTNHTDENGLLHFSVFDTTYLNVQSLNNEKVIAPGTTGQCIVRIQNKSQNETQYIITITDNKTDKSIPSYITVNTPSNAVSTHSSILPSNTEADVVSSYAGTLHPNNSDDYTIIWTWDFEGNDVIDTQLGNKAVTDPDSETIGVCVVTIGDDGSYIYPSYNTEQPIVVYILIILAFIHSFILIFIIKKKKKGAPTDENS